MSRKFPYSSLLPYYGAKSVIAHLYPEPAYKTLIEPFAGGASYSLRYYDHDVILNDLWEPVYQVWAFVTSPDALRWVRERIPRTVEAGTRIEDLTKPGDPIGLMYLMHAQAAQAAFGMSVRQKITPMGAKCWNENFVERLEFWLPRIRHWQVRHGSYADLPDVTATYFVDPPYQNAAGTKYKESSVDYAHLAQWCQSRRGQVMACDNAGATWMPFVSLTDHRVAGLKVSENASAMGEVIWHRNDAAGVFA